MSSTIEDAPSSMTSDDPYKLNEWCKEMKEQNPDSETCVLPTRMTNLGASDKCQGGCDKPDIVALVRSELLNQLSFTLRWRTTNKGGEIKLYPEPDYNPLKHPILKLGEDANARGAGIGEPISLTFYRAINISIAGKYPDCLVSMLLKSPLDAKNPENYITLRLYIPFKTKEKITPGTKVLEKIVENITTYQPNENDDPTRLSNINPAHLLPVGSGFYQALSADQMNKINQESKAAKKRKEEYKPKGGPWAFWQNIMVFKDYQAITSDDMDRLNSLFKLDASEVQTLEQEQGERFPIIYKKLRK